MVSCAAFALPVSETETLFGDAACVLHPEGELHVSTMEDDPAKSGFKSSSDGEGKPVHTTCLEGGFLTSAISGASSVVRDIRSVY